MGWRHDRLSELKEQRADLERLRESGLADTDALEQKLDDLDDDIEHIERDIQHDEDEAREDVRDEKPPEEAREELHDSGPLDVDKVHNFETFPEVPDHEPEVPSDEPINAWELDGAAREGDGGDQLRSDSVIPDLGQKAPKGPLSDEAEARIDGAEERLPPLVGDVPPMGGPDEGLLPPPSLAPRSIDDLPNFETFPPLPEEPREELDGIDDIASRPAGGVPSTLVAVPFAVVFGILAFLAASRIGVPDAASAASGAPTAAVIAAVAQSATAAGYQCVGDQKVLFDNSSGGIANNGASSGPTFSTAGKTYCLVSMRTYHWNVGKGAGPGKIGLTGGAGSVGPFQAQGTSGQGGAPNVNWIYVPDPAERQLLQGDYSCYDSDLATWSQNDASGRAGFCTVYVQDAVKK